MLNILSNIICDTFRVEVGKGQQFKTHVDGLTVPERCPLEKALRVKFKAVTDFDVEEGYRWVDVVIYGPQNYVQVWVRKSWDVISNDDLVYGDDGECRIKKGSPGYQKGESPWEKIADHDSCWTDGVDRLLRGDHGKLVGLQSQDHRWYEIIDFSSLGIPAKKSA